MFELLLLAIPFLVFGNFHYEYQIQHGWYASIVFLAIALWRRFGFVPAASYAYFALIAARTWPIAGKAIPADKFLPGDKVEAAASRIFAGLNSYLFLTAVAITALVVSEKMRKTILDNIGILVAATSLILIGTAPFLQFGAKAWLDNSSVDCSFLMVLFAVFAYREDKGLIARAPKPVLYLILVLPLLATIIGSSSIGLAAYFVAIAAWAFAAYGPKVKLSIAGLACVGVFLFLVLYHHDKIQSSGRFDMWKLQWTTFKVFINKWSGYGSGTFYLFGPARQTTVTMALKQQVEALPLFWTAHNEFLQVLWETGIKGLAVFTTALLAMAWKTYRTPWQFSAFTTTVFIMCFSPPLRYYASASLLALLLAEVYEIKERSSFGKKLSDFSKVVVKLGFDAIKTELSKKAA